MTPDRPLRLLISAGEVSGDLHAAAVLRALRGLVDRPIEAYGIGGDQLAAEGCEVLAHTDQTAVIGLWEALRRYGFFRGLMRRLEREIERRPPELVLTIDYPGFNLRLAARARRRGLRTVHYICPQVWAWRPQRIPRIAEVLDALIVLFPFEPALFDGTGLAVRFTGHPLVDRAAATRAEPPAALPWGEGRRVAIFPGSRPSEIRRLLADLVAAAAETERRIGPCSFLIPSPTPAVARQVERALDGIADRPRRLVVTQAASRQVLLQAEAALIKSGTSTLEASLMLCPAAIVYRVSTPSYLLLRRMVTGIRHIGLVNILAGREICREFVQGALKPGPLADELVRLLTRDDDRQAMIEAMREVNAALGAPGTADRTARAILEFLNPPPPGAT